MFKDLFSHCYASKQSCFGTKLTALSFFLNEKVNFKIPKN